MNICVWNYESWSHRLRSRQSSSLPLWLRAGAPERAASRAGVFNACSSRLTGWLLPPTPPLRRAVILPALSKEASCPASFLRLGSYLSSRTRPHSSRRCQPHLAVLVAPHLRFGSPWTPPYPDSGPAGALFFAIAIATWRIRLWLAGGWARRGQRLSTAPENPRRRSWPSSYLPLKRTLARGRDAQALQRWRTP